MARSLFIEEESGVSTGRVHPHNGYYAGDFSSVRTGSGPFDASARSRSAVSGLSSAPAIVSSAPAPRSTSWV